VIYRFKNSVELMKGHTMRFILCAITAFLFFVNCDNDPVSSPSVVNSETWVIADVEDTSSTATLTFDSLSNGTVTVSGEWVYIFWDYEITCKFLTGNATINDTSVSINVTGTASYPPQDSTGYIESSPFALSMTGKFSNGETQGTWDISFTKDIWDGSVENGSFTGTRKQGSGITR
jgi:hypothetical protein